jgi:hypothetical protein
LQPQVASGMFNLAVRFSLSQPAYVTGIRYYLSSTQLVGGTAQLYDAATRRLLASVPVPAAAAAGWFVASLPTPPWLDVGMYMASMSSVGYSYTDGFDFQSANSSYVTIVGEQRKL